MSRGPLRQVAAASWRERLS